MSEIDKLVAPIALYPDVLISQILPAATFPTDIVMAARWCRDHSDLKDLDKQKWDLSVISVCRYPPVLDKMDQDLEWTNALGAAFMNQPEDVMSAIQTLRHQAEAVGVLKSTPQQSVVIDEQAIRIVPAEKEVIYVPQYNPQIIYVHDDDDDDDDVSAAGAVAASALSFTAGLAMGAWLDNDCDWNHGVVVACRPGYWGGWHYRGAVAWDDDWVAARGPRRGFVAGENGGAYLGPRGAAVWGGDGHGAAWRRPVGAPLPAYSGRYANYANVSGNRRNLVAGNEINVNRNNVNIDRGDRTMIQGGDRAYASGGDRVNAGRTGNESVFNNRSSADQINRERNRGVQSTANSANRSRSGTNDRRSANQYQSAFNQRSSSRDVTRQSQRGASSRGQAGGGGRGGRSGRR